MKRLPISKVSLSQILMDLIVVVVGVFFVFCFVLLFLFCFVVFVLFCLFVCFCCSLFCFVLFFVSVFFLIFANRAHF